MRNGGGRTRAARAARTRRAGATALALLVVALVAGPAAQVARAAGGDGARTVPPEPRELLGSAEAHGVVHLVFARPATVERYDLAGAAFLPSLPLPGEPSAFDLDARGLRVAVGRRVIAFGEDGSPASTLFEAEADIVAMAGVGDSLYLGFDTAVRTIAPELPPAPPPAPDVPSGPAGPGGPGGPGGLGDPGGPDGPDGPDDPSVADEAAGGGSPRTPLSDAPGTGEATTMLLRLERHDGARLALELPDGDEFTAPVRRLLALEPSVSADEAGTAGRTALLVGASVPGPLTRLRLARDGGPIARTGTSIAAVGALFALPGGERIVDEHGQTMDAVTLASGPRLDEALDGVTALDGTLVTLAGDRLLRHEGDWLPGGALEIGRRAFAVHADPLAAALVAFGEEADGELVASHHALADFTLAASSAPPEPEGLAFVPDAIVPLPDGSVLLASVRHRALYRYLIAEERWGTTIALAASPRAFALDATGDTLHVAYPDGLLGTIDLHTARATMRARWPEEVRRLIATDAGLLLGDARGDHLLDVTGEPYVTLDADTGGDAVVETAWSPPARELLRVRASAAGFRLDRWRPAATIATGTDPRIDTTSDDTAGDPADLPPADGGLALASVHPPLHLSGDAGTLLLGSGQLLDARDLAPLARIDAPFDGAAWLLDGSLATVATDGASAGGYRLRRWSATFEPVLEASLDGTFVALVPDPASPLLVDLVDGLPRVRRMLDVLAASVSAAPPPSASVAVPTRTAGPVSAAQGSGGAVTTLAGASSATAARTDAPSPASGEGEGAGAGADGAEDAGGAGGMLLAALAASLLGRRRPGRRLSGHRLPGRRLPG